MLTVWGGGGGGGGGGNAGYGWGFDQEVKILPISGGWGRIRSSNVVKNPHPGAYLTNLIYDLSYLPYETT